MSWVEGSDPYPWPFGGDLCGSAAALVVAGAQPRWRSCSVGAADAASRIATIAGAMVASGGRVIAVRHGHHSAAARTTARPVGLPIRSTAEWHIDPGLPVDRDGWIADAAGYDGFYGSSLDRMLRDDGRSQIVLVGFAAELCVDSTLRSANDQGYECLVVADACAPIDRTIGARALNSVTMSGGIFGAVGTTAALCAAMRCIEADADGGTVT